MLDSVKFKLTLFPNKDNHDTERRKISSPFNKIEQLLKKRWREILNLNGQLLVK